MQTAHFWGTGNKFGAAAYVTMHVVKWWLWKWCSLDFWGKAHILGAARP